MASSADFSNIADKSAVPVWAMLVGALAFKKNNKIHNTNKVFPASRVNDQGHI